MYNPDGTVRGVARAYEDITDRRRAEEQLQRLAHYDQLTGLPNRLSLQKELGRLLAGDGRKQPTSIALFDLDGFKDVNDTLGHSTGDQLLIEVGQRLTDVAEATRGQVCRLGGDEFVVVVPDCGDPLRGRRDRRRRCSSGWRSPITINDHVLHVGGSAGVAIAPADGASVDELIANADLALYQAKSDGGRICRFFLPVLRAQAQARRSLDLELRRAFAENEFELYFQPQIRLADEAVVGAEALMRWRHPERGILAPGAFIDTLAASAIAPEVGRWIIQTACAASGGLARRWASARPHRRQPVSRASWATKPCCSDIDDALRATGLPAEALELEITENVALNFEDAAGAAEAARQGRQARLRRLRHRLCLAELSDPLSALAHQDRPQLRRQDHRRRRRRRHRALADRDGAQSRARSHRRGRRDRARRPRSCSTSTARRRRAFSMPSRCRPPSSRPILRTQPAWPA